MVELASMTLESVPFKAVDGYGANAQSHVGRCMVVLVAAGRMEAAVGTVVGVCVLQGGTRIVNGVILEAEWVV